MSGPSSGPEAHATGLPGLRVRRFLYAPPRRARETSFAQALGFGWAVRVAPFAKQAVHLFGRARARPRPHVRVVRRRLLAHDEEAKRSRPGSMVGSVCAKAISRASSLPSPFATRASKRPKGPANTARSGQGWSSSKRSQRTSACGGSRRHVEPDDAVSGGHQGDVEDGARFVGNRGFRKPDRLPGERRPRGKGDVAGYPVSAPSSREPEAEAWRTFGPSFWHGRNRGRPDRRPGARGGDVAMGPCVGEVRAHPVHDVGMRLLGHVVALARVGVEIEELLGHRDALLRPIRIVRRGRIARRLRATLAEDRAPIPDDEPSRRAPSVKTTRSSSFSPRTRGIRDRPVIFGGPLAPENLEHRGWDVDVVADARFHLAVFQGARRVATSGMGIRVVSSKFVTAW